MPGAESEKHHSEMLREILTSREHHHSSLSPPDRRMTNSHQISASSPISLAQTTGQGSTKKEGGSSLTLKKWAVHSLHSPTTPKMLGRTPSKSDQPMNQH